MSAQNLSSKYLTLAMVVRFSFRSRAPDLFAAPLIPGIGWETRAAQAR